MPSELELEDEDDELGADPPDEDEEDELGAGPPEELEDGAEELAAGAVELLDFGDEELEPQAARPSAPSTSKATIRRRGDLVMVVLIIAPLCELGEFSQPVRRRHITACSRTLTVRSAAATPVADHARDGSP